MKKDYFLKNVLTIKNVNIHEFSYPITTKIYKFKGANQQKASVHAVELTPHSRFLRLKTDHISANSKQNLKIL
jgi:hypothetical protein